MLLGQKPSLESHFRLPCRGLHVYIVAMFIDSDLNSDLDLPSVNFCSSSLTGGIFGHSEEHTKGVDSWKGQIALVPLMWNTCTNQNINGSYFNQLNIHLLTVKEISSKMSLRIHKLTYPETSHPHQPIQYNFSS